MSSSEASQRSRDKEEITSIAQLLAANEESAGSQPVILGALESFRGSDEKRKSAQSLIDHEIEELKDAEMAESPNKAEESSAQVISISS